MTSHEVGALAMVLGLAATHVFGPRLRFLDRVPRSRLLSAFGGVSVAYVVVHLLPNVAEAQETLADAGGGALAPVERHAYLVALVGLSVYYGLERAARRSGERSGARGSAATSPGVFTLSMVSFGAYNMLVGYLLVQQAEDDPLAQVGLVAAALALHFVVNDYGLRAHHQHRYERSGRWVLAAAAGGGWLAGVLTTVSHAVLAVVEAFLAGGIIVNVLKEELPEERESSFTAFALGAAAYAAVLLTVE